MTSRSVGIPAGWQLTMRQALRDAVSYQAIRGSGPGRASIAREQAGLYLALGREFGLKAQSVSCAELAARRTSAAAALADFSRENQATVRTGRWDPGVLLERALRLATELGSVLAELDRLPGADK